MVELLVVPRGQLLLVEVAEFLRLLPVPLRKKPEPVALMLVRHLPLARLKVQLQPVPEQAPRPVLRPPLVEVQVQLAQVPAVRPFQPAP